MTISDITQRTISSGMSLKQKKWSSLTLVFHIWSLTPHALPVELNWSTSSNIFNNISATHKLLSVALHILLCDNTFQPNLLHCSPCFFIMLTVANRNKNSKIMTLKSLDCPPQTSPISTTESQHRAFTIVHDPTHSLISLLPSGHRCRSLTWKRAHFKNSFVPLSSWSS